MTSWIWRRQWLASTPALVRVAIITLHSCNFWGVNVCHTWSIKYCAISLAQFPKNCFFRESLVISSANTPYSPIFSFPSICLASIIASSGTNPGGSSSTRPGGGRGELHLQFALRLQPGTSLSQNTHHHEIYITGVASFLSLLYCFSLSVCVSILSPVLCFFALPSALPFCVTPHLLHSSQCFAFLCYPPSSSLSPVLCLFVLPPIFFTLPHFLSLFYRFLFMCLVSPVYVCTSFPPPSRQELFEERRRGKTTSVSSVDQNEVVNNLLPSPFTSGNRSTHAHTHTQQVQPAVPLSPRKPTSTVKAILQNSVVVVPSAAQVAPSFSSEEPNSSSTSISNPHPPPHHSAKPNSLPPIKSTPSSSAPTPLSQPTSAPPSVTSPMPSLSSAATAGSVAASNGTQKTTTPKLALSPWGQSSNNSPVSAQSPHSTASPTTVVLAQPPLHTTQAMVRLNPPTH